MSGSGVIYQIDDDYTYIITNYHVIDVPTKYYYSSNNSVVYTNYTASSKIKLYLYGSEGSGYFNSNNVPEYDAGYVECDYVGGSLYNDLAIIRAKTSDLTSINSAITPVKFASGYNVGQTAVAIGNTLGYGISVTQGVVSVDNEYVTVTIGETDVTYRALRMDTAISNGNSGGGLFNESGELIGINSAGSSELDSMNFAIPGTLVQTVADNIVNKYNGTTNLTTINLGLTVAGSNSKYVYDADTGFGNIVENVVVSKITTGGIASLLGLKVGDVIKQIKIGDDTFEITRDYQIDEILYLAKIGETLKITYERGGEERAESRIILSTDIVTVA
jgi:serine protease Do